MAGPDSTSESLDPEQIERMVDDALGAIAAAADSAQLKAVRQTHAADRSPLALANHSIGSMPKERRKDAGRLIGRARGRVNEALAARAAELEAAELAARLEAERVDVTLPVVEHPVGAEHPLTALINRMCDVFVAMGWEVVEGPELEAEWLNFDALNFTPDHPARFMSDTLFVDPPSGHTIMRTQTSPVQVRTLLDRALPVYVVSPGKVFRADEYDATHLPVFHQLEGLAVDRGITICLLYTSDAADD